MDHEDMRMSSPHAGRAHTYESGISYAKKGFAFTFKKAIWLSTAGRESFPAALSQIAFLSVTSKPNCPLRVRFLILNSTFLNSVETASAQESSLPLTISIDPLYSSPYRPGPRHQK